MKRRAFILSTLVGLVLMTVPALALSPLRSVVRFERGAPASSKALNDFDQLQAGAPAGMSPQVQPLSARKVLESGGHAVWVAPTAKGGFCYVVTGTVSGCRSTRGPEEGRGALDPTIFRLNGVVTRITGNVLSQHAERIAVQYTNGETADVPFTWVTAPINAGFYDFTVAADATPIKLAAYDMHGREIAAEPIAP